MSPAGPGRAERLSSVLVVNAGSTSLKLSAVDEGGNSRPLAALDEAPGDAIAAAHRIVHGGSHFREPVLLDERVLGELRGLVELAPLHNGPALAAIDETRRALPALPNVAVFDTEFHAAMPYAASAIAVPARWRDGLHLRRYGFHGLSVQWSSERVPVERLIVCHLGGGCSVSAVRDGHSLDTTMGFSPLEGVPMATRSGSLDATAVLYLLRAGGGSPEQVEHVLEHESGLLGLSGVSGNVDELERSAEPAARHALELYCYRIACAVGSLAVALEGLDAIVFTGGVGEGSALVRANVCARLGVLGVEVDQAANDAADPAADADIASSASRVRVIVVKAREDVVAARLARRVLAKPQSLHQP
jgi:acetate kinase